jgi:hypothetical protein
LRKALHAVLQAAKADQSYDYRDRENRQRDLQIARH